MAINRSVWRALSILELFANGQALTLREVQQALDLPKSSAYNLLDTLQTFGALEIQDKQLKTYVIGSKMLSLGQSARKNSDLYRHAHAELEKLSAETGHTAYLAVERNGSILYLDKVEAPKPIAITCDIGDKNYLHATALGKALLATKSDAKLRQELPEHFPALTKTTLTSREELIKELSVIRKKQYAMDRQEGMDFIKCLAAPIRDDAGRAVAAISLSLLVNEFDVADQGFLVEAVKQSALAISRHLGFAGNELY